MISLICLTLMGVSIHLLGEEDTETESLPKLITPIQAIVPLPLHNTNLNAPRVVAKVQVSSDGLVEDLVVHQASHIGLVQRAENLIRQSVFETSGMAKGESVRFDLILPFYYPSQLGISSMTTGDDIELMVNTVQNKDLRLDLCPPEELDELPQLVDRGVVYMPENKEGERIPGIAKVEFYVNHEGDVRLARIITSTHGEVSAAAIATVQDMKFTPPICKGKPAVTILRMPFSVK